MNEYQSIDQRLDELRNGRGHPFFGEECDIIEEAIDDADAAGDITLREKQLLLAKFYAILARPKAA